MIKAIIFDVDDTLIRSSDVLYIHDCDIARQMNLTVPSRELYFSLWGKPLEEMVSIMHPNTNFQEYLAVGQEIPKRKMELFPNVKNILEQLSSKFSLSLLTSKKECHLMSILDELDLRKYFVYVHTEESSHFKKPNARVFENSILYYRTQGIKVDELLYVGDMVTDYITARNAGINFVGVLTGVDSQYSFETNGCFKVITTLDDLPVFLKALDRFK